MNTHHETCRHLREAPDEATVARAILRALGSKGTNALALELELELAAAAPAGGARWLIT